MTAASVTIKPRGDVIVGRRCELDVAIHAAEDIRVTGVDAFVRCFRGWSLGPLARANEIIDFDIRRRFAGPGVIAAGVTKFDIALTVPEDMPPSHTWRNARAGIEVRIVVGLPWRRNYERRVALPVRRKPQLPIHRTPVILRSHDGALEVRLDSTRLIAGETMTGTCTRHPPVSRFLDVAFVPEFALHGRGPAIIRAAGSRDVALPLWVNVPFRVPVPSDLVPSFASSTHDMRWRLVARSRGTPHQVEVGLDILDRSALGETSRLALAHTLEDEALANALMSYGRRLGWRVGSEVRGGVVVSGTRAGMTLGMASVYRAQQFPAEPVVVAQITYPSFGVGLDVVPTTPLGHALVRDIEAGVPEWDRVHVVQARHAFQAMPLLGAIVPWLVGERALGSLIQWNDTQIIFERKHVRAGDVATMAIGLERIADVIGRASLDIPPPPGMTVDLERWHELARWVGGTLSIGDLSIAGKMSGLAVNIGLGASGRGLEVSVESRVGEMSLGSEPVAKLLQAWPDVELRFGNRAAIAKLALVDRIADATRVRTLVRDLCALVAGHEAGPYR